MDALMHRRRVLFAVCCLLFAVCCLLFAFCFLLFARQKSITASIRNAGSACRISSEFP
ncbi:hypothetical protein VDF98_11800 [Xanthomonas campestris pv. raphani]|uniref:hypothetical protein n=1 Tax=Xanthomonas campestris TaxID=339 RepID=UPI002368D892|nr:hypothetical protein [Xanthomonas campestris]MEA9764175.1 hypothetical protein [Xanthomonas campestris pv. raphani]MEA9816655.1 hypothetical protein [Xanthomonas campestris pv. raphani]MEA9824078.1 hypothetical protein [Xanthomonas campestris pv. raphani]MEA9852304.1 hypothetical protein [Xanthomonas campestris pv. raphani]MEA9856624.1 hypothetical protein [Xanthomonas campestris pv. raphani]